MKVGHIWDILCKSCNSVGYYQRRDCKYLLLILLEKEPEIFKFTFSCFIENLNAMINKELTFEHIASVEIIHFRKGNTQKDRVKILAGFYMKLKYKITSLKSTYKTVMLILQVAANVGKLMSEEKLVYNAVITQNFFPFRMLMHNTWRIVAKVYVNKFRASCPCQVFLPF